METVCSSSSSSPNLSPASSDAKAEVEAKPSLIPPAWEANLVREIRRSEHRAAALSLAHAFAEDDLARYLVSADDVAGISAEERWRIHVDVMDRIVAAHCFGGVVATAGADYESVALWLPPGKSLDGWWTSLRSGLWRLRFRLSSGGRKRYAELTTLLRDAKADVLGERDSDAWYLVYLGTKPCGRRRGRAGKLLEDVIRRADAENRPIYLESSSPANNDYYERFGFRVRKDVFLGRGTRDAVRLSLMVREPRHECKGANAAAVEVGGDFV